jgi:hypothetical protein
MCKIHHILCIFHHHYQKCAIYQSIFHHLDHNPSVEMCCNAFLCAHVLSNTGSECPESRFLHSERSGPPSPAPNVTTPVNSRVALSKSSGSGDSSYDPKDKHGARAHPPGTLGCVPYLHTCASSYLPDSGAWGTAALWRKQWRRSVLSLHPLC